MVVVVVLVVLVGAPVVEVVVLVVTGGEAWACAGTITLFTSGFVHFPGKMSVVATPPIKIVRIIWRRSNFGVLSSISTSSQRRYPHREAQANIKRETSRIMIRNFRGKISSQLIAHQQMDVN